MVVIVVVESHIGVVIVVHRLVEALDVANEYVFLPLLGGRRRVSIVIQQESYL